MDALRQYCELEAELNRCWSKGNTPTMAMVNGHRHYSSEFYDTPASQKVSTTPSQPATPSRGTGGRPPEADFGTMSRSAGSTLRVSSLAAS